MKYTPAARIGLADRIHTKRSPTGLLPLFDFVAAVRAGGTPDAKTLTLLADRIEKILDGTAADTALELHVGKGSKRTRMAWAKTQAMAWDVMKLRDQDVGRDEAIQRISARHHKSFSTVEKAYDAHGPALRHLDALLEAIVTQARRDSALMDASMAETTGERPAPARRKRRKPTPKK